MRFEILPTPENKWEMRPLSGPFDGVCIAVAEGVCMSDVTFVGKRIIGRPRSIWGFKVLQQVLSDQATSFGVGLNRPFDNKAKSKAIFDGENYISVESSKPLKTVQFLNTFRSGIFFKEYPIGQVVKYTGGLPI